MRPARFLPVIFLSVLPILAGASPAPGPLSEERLGAELGRVLSAHYNLDGDLQVEVLRPWTAPEKSAAAWQVVVNDFPPSPSGYMVLRYQLFADGNEAAEGSLSVHAFLWRDVWFARQPIASGSIFNPYLLDARRVDWFRVHDALPASSGDRSYIVARDVAADRMLTWHDLARRPLVRKGQIVEATAQDGLLFVSMKALALENGARGDIVSLRNLESHKEISAEVVEEGRVEIHF